jgi:hypothetical protein
MRDGLVKVDDNPGPGSFNINSNYSSVTSKGFTIKGKYDIEDKETIRVPGNS